MPAEQPIELLDVGTGAADIPRDLLRRAQGTQFRLRITATDVRPEVVASARARSARVENLAIALVRVDRLDYPANALEPVHHSLPMQPLERDGAQRFLPEMRRVARRAVIVTDLQRSPRSWRAAWLRSHLLNGNR